MDAKELARYIDHTLLKPEATPAQIARLCEEALEYGFASVCLHGAHIKQAAAILKGSDVKTGCTVGFPFGANATRVKVYEALAAIEDGADEVDMVQFIGALKAGDDDAVHEDIAAVVSAAHAEGCLVKVILENVLLTGDEKRRACGIAKDAGADFVKTSTGFAGGGATLEDVRLMREAVGAEMGVKAAGGIRTFEDAVAMIEAGATRIGASSGVAIVQGAAGKGDY